jgi:hypothetical protein
MPFTIKQEEKEAKVGTTTENFIEKNRKILKDMKEEARGNTYDG